MTPVSPIMHTYFRNHNVAITLRHAQSSPNMVATMALRYVLRAAIALREVQQLPYMLRPLSYIGYSRCLTSRAVIALMVMVDRDSKQSA